MGPVKSELVQKDLAQLRIDLQSIESQVVSEASRLSADIAPFVDYLELKQKARPDSLDELHQ
jgi:hypothetical protein